MKKMLIITDSLGLPRPKPEIVEYNDTWVKKISIYYDVWQYSSGGATIIDLYSQIEYYKMFNPDIVLIQSGIVDCAPRALTKFESQFLNHFTLSKKITSKMLTKRRLENMRKRRKCTYTSLENFEEVVKLFKNEFKNKLFWIGIMPASDNYETIVPGIKKNIELFNNVIKKNLFDNYLPVADFTNQYLMSDNIHLSKEGHSLLFERISSKLNL
jgi:lysophospholipase L1-like esterase